MGEQKLYPHIIYTLRVRAFSYVLIGRDTAGAMEEEHEGYARFQYEVRDGRRLKFFAGQPGNYVGVTQRKGKFKNSFYARTCVT